MSDEEKEKNAEAEELEVQEQVQDAPAEEKVAEPSLEEELLKWRDTAMRTAAEYDNYRKRMVKERRNAPSSPISACWKNFYPSLIILKWAWPPPAQMPPP